MSSRRGQTVSVSKKKSPTRKGIVRKSRDGRKIVIIVNKPARARASYYVTFTAILNVWNGSKEFTTLWGF